MTETEANDVAKAEHLLRGLTHGDRPLHAALRTLLAEYDRRGDRIVDLEAGREVEQHMVRYAAVQVEEAKRQRDAALALHCDVEGQGYDGDGDYVDYDHACSTCGVADEYAVAWPCPTVQALGGAS